jgi:predicted  nucleic acid-binding Zn-ribbon protein
MGYDCVAKKMAKKEALKKEIKTLTVIGSLQTELEAIINDIDAAKSKVTGLENSLNRAKITLETLEVKERYLSAAISEFEETNPEEWITASLPTTDDEEDEEEEF